MAYGELETVARKLEELEYRILDPEVRASRTALIALIAPDFLEFGSSGREFDRDSIIEALNSESSPLPAMQIVDFKLHTLTADTMLITYGLKRKGEGARLQSLRSSIWKQIDGEWLLYFHQGTRVPEPV